MVFLEFHRVSRRFRIGLLGISLDFYGVRGHHAEKRSPGTGWGAGGAHSFPPPPPLKDQPSKYRQFSYHKAICARQPKRPIYSTAACFTVI